MQSVYQDEVFKRDNHVELSSPLIQDLDVAELIDRDWAVKNEFLNANTYTYIFF